MLEAHRCVNGPRGGNRRSATDKIATAFGLGLLVVGFIGCSCTGGGRDGTSDGDSTDATEAIGEPDASDTGRDPTADEIRAALGIPAEAARVLVFGQSAHLSSEGQPPPEPERWTLVADIFSRALDALEADSNYRYAMAEVAWLRQYWETHPERHEAIRRFNGEGRLAVVGGAVSSPDLVLPLAENLLRDYRASTKWLSSVGLSRTSSAWLPDSNGLGPTTPDLLDAAGFDAVAFWHADGAAEAPAVPTSVEDFAHLSHASGSGAHVLASANAIDFIWEGTGGARVFAHWLSHGYLLGDHLDYERIDERELREPAGIRADETGILDNIQAMADLVLPMSPTDYGFVSVGGDFQYPKRDLVRWMQAWNAERYASTGVWAVAATFDDFAKLAMTQAARLTVRAIDFTPYRMGAFATREQLKEDARLTSAALSQAEAAAGVAGLDVDPVALDGLAWRASQTNYHDWITGTSVSASVVSERAEATRRLREDAEAFRDALMAKLAERIATDSFVVVNTDHHRRNARFALPWNVPDGAVHIVSGDYGELALASAEGGVLRGSVWLEPLSIEALTVVGWGAERPIMVVRCMKDEGVVPCGEADRVEVDQGPYSTLTFDRRSGGTLLTFDGSPDGSNLLTGPAFRLYDYVDEGGPAALGHELMQPDCGFTLAGEIVPNGPVAVDVNAMSDATVVAFSWEQGGVTWKRQYRIGPEQLDPLDVEFSIGVAPGHAIVAHFDTRVKGEMWMAVPGGVVKRQAEKRFSPTFWPFERWVAKVEPGAATFGVIAPSNPAVSFGEDGRIEVMLGREVGSACEEIQSGALRPATLSMRVVSTYPHDVNGGVAATMDGFARDVFEPLLAVRGTGQSSHVEPGWITSITSTSTDAVEFDWRIRVARFAKTPEGYVLTLEKRMLAPQPKRVVLTTRFPVGTIIELLDATEGLREVLEGANPEHFVVPMERTYLTLRFRPPELPEH